MRVLLAATSLKPSYGGPAISVSRLALALAEHGLEVGLWAADGSARETSYLPAQAPVQRLGGSPADAIAEFPGIDVLHDNGLWMPHHHRWARLCRQRNIPRIVSTRGMLEPWALNHKPLRKRVAWRLYQAGDLRHCRLLHATSRREAGNLEALGLGVTVRYVPNGVDIPPGERREGSVKGARTALFLGRIYPVKGLDLLVEAWARVRPADWSLKIAGPDQAGHRREIEKLIARLGLTGSIDFTGPMDGEAKRQALLAADLFVLPSHSESFGMAIAEALAHGLPVLTTRGTPWEELPRRGCGWRVEAAVEGLAAGLERATATPTDTLRAMGQAGRQWMTEEFSWKRVSAETHECYRAAVGVE